MPVDAGFSERTIHVCLRFVPFSASLGGAARNAGAFGLLCYSCGHRSLVW